MRLELLCKVVHTPNEGVSIYLIMIDNISYIHSMIFDFEVRLFEV